MNANDIENMQAIMDNPRRWSGFTAQLFRLICKADMDNTFKLAMAFPDEVKAVCAHVGRAYPEPVMSPWDMLTEINTLTDKCQRQGERSIEHKRQIEELKLALEEHGCDVHRDEKGE